MLVLIALGLVVLAGAFLIALGLLAWVRPGAVREFLLGFAATAPRHYSELVLRLMVGVALLLAAPRMAGAAAVEVAAWVLVGTTVILGVVPWRLHRAFARRVVPGALAWLPFIGLASLLGGAAILWSVWAGRAA